MKRINWQVGFGRAAAVVGLLFMALTSSAMMPVAHAQNGAPCLLSGQTFWMNITQQAALERAQNAIRAGGLRVADTQSFWVYGEGNQFSVFIFCPADDGSGSLTVPRATRLLVHIQVAGPPGSNVGSLRDFLGEHMRRGQNPGGTSGGSSTPPTSGLELAGDWRDNGGNEYRITKRGDRYFGTYLKVNDLLKSSGFTVGEEGFRNFTPVPGKANTFEGEVKWRSSGGGQFWKEKSVITLSGDSLTITECTYPQWVRIGQPPGGTGGGGNPPAGSRDISGRWEQTTPGSGTSTWKITRLSDGTYSAEETGLGGAKGTATLTGNRLRIDFTWSGGAGYYEWELDATYAAGQGKMVFTRGLSGTYPNSKVKRQ